VEKRSVEPRAPLHAAARNGDLDPAALGPGIFPAQYLAAAVAKKWVSGSHALHGQLQPASLDLTLGRTAFRLLCSFLPDRESRVADKLDRYAFEEFSIEDGAILERNRAYLIPLAETLALPEAVRGRTNPKSSTGRLDIFTRVICDNNARFDEIPFGYEGQLYLEVVPRSFLVSVVAGLSLNQLRLVTGDPGTARVSDSELAALHLERSIVLADDEAVPGSDLDLAEGLFLSVDLGTDRHGQVAYRARKNSHVIDLSSTGRYSWDEFWEPVRPEPGSRLILEPEEFYLLLSRESVAVPPELAAEMSAYDPTAGELRTHYAGFFDPGFGYRGDSWPNGSRATLEVRARDVPFMIEHGQRLCRLTFERLHERTQLLYGDEIGSTYQNQRLTLSKHFTSQGPTGQLSFPEPPLVRRSSLAPDGSATATPERGDPLEARS
jgi:dCTP deaminase